MTTSPTIELRVRTGNWGWPGIYLVGHAPVTLRLAPDDLPDVLVQLVDGAKVVPRKLRAAEVRVLRLLDGGGVPRLVVTPGTGVVERHPGRRPEGSWELQIEGPDQRGLHLYALASTPYPDDATLDALAARVVVVGSDQ